MKTTRRSRPAVHRVCTAWLAAWLVVFAALAPLVSHALAQGNVAQTTEICTATGPQTVALPSAGDAAAPDNTPAPAGGHGLAHCPFCLLQADRMALPSHAPRLHPPPTLAVRVAAPACVVTFPETPYNHAAPRAPPARS